MGQGAKLIRPNITGNNFVLAPPTVHIMEDEIEEITSFPTPFSRPAWFMSQYEDAFRAAGSTPDDLRNSESLPERKHADAGLRSLSSFGAWGRNHVESH